MIVVTAPTGSIGHQVVDTLLDAGEDVRVIVRNPAKLSRKARDQADVVPGSHGDPEVVSRAFDGAEAVFWLYPPNPVAVDVAAGFESFTRSVCKALTDQRVVGISALGRGTPWAGHAGLVTASLRMDDLIAATGVSYRALTLPSFMENIAQQAGAIKSQGAFYLPADGDHKAPTVASRDIAAVAVALLRDRSWGGGFEEVPVLGPEDLSLHERAAIMTEVLGFPVRFQPVGGEAFIATMTGKGMSEAMARSMVEMFQAKDKGLDNAVRRTERNATPTTFRQWCAEVLKPSLS
jgi:uncharacterized protein YbjT (DUF2867 family)